ncbi:hypothetical protein D9M72_488950 [compost metagenome]
MQRENLGAIVFSHRQVIQVQRIPGRYLAPHVAVAAMDTSALPPAVLVQESLRMTVIAGVLPCGVPMLGKCHRQRQFAEAPAPSAGFRALAQ